jgi:hypothetical protein
VPGCQQSNARHIPLAFSFIDLVCIESNLLHNLIRKNPGRLPVRVSALKKPDKKQRVKDRGCKRGEKSERERGIWKLHSWKRPEEERIGLWLDLSPLYSTLPTRFVSATCIRIQLVEIWFLSRIMFQLILSNLLLFLFHVWTQEKAIMHYKMAWKLTSCWTIPG